MSISDADRLAYDKKPTIKLKTGATLELSYSYGALRVIEDKLGSVGKLVAELDKGIDGKLFTSVFYGLYAGAWRVPGLTEEKFDDLIDLTDLESHATMLGEALMAAFPQKAQEENGEPLEASPTSSTGPEPVISPPPSLVSALNSSGI